MDLGASSTFVLEPAESAVMRRPPRRPKSDLLNATMIARMLTGSLTLFLIVGGCFLAGDPVGNLARARTMAFIGWMFAHFILAFNFRTFTEPIIFHGFFTNKLIFAWMGGIVVAVVLCLFVPFLRTVSKVVPLSAQDVLGIFLLSFVGTSWIELLKILQKYCGRKRA